MHDRRNSRKMRDKHPYGSSHEDFLKHLRSLMKGDSKTPDLPPDKLDKLFDELFDDDN